MINLNSLEKNHRYAFQNKLIRNIVYSKKCAESLILSKKDNMKIRDLTTFFVKSKLTIKIF
jgi:hypothetical protein